MFTDARRTDRSIFAVRIFALCTVLLTIGTVLSTGVFGQDEGCTAENPIACNEYCCPTDTECRWYDSCCVQIYEGNECPVGSCIFCEAAFPQCVGWSEENYVCCRSDATTCALGNDVWCCNADERCDSFKGHCL